MGKASSDALITADKDHCSGPPLPVCNMCVDGQGRHGRGLSAVVDDA